MLSGCGNPQQPEINTDERERPMHYLTVHYPRLSTGWRLAHRAARHLIALTRSCPDCGARPGSRCCWPCSSRYVD
ncbi:hypothetical protein ACFV2X_48105 [Streptomyces sp. NPDC059679]|uniref:hypothetical protein n=1 Tax=Streptomyces sp. NPDC059679 TaxID=3346903 RepID=UPI0036AE33D9